MTAMVLCSAVPHVTEGDLRSLVTPFGWLKHIRGFRAIVAHGAEANLTQLSSCVADLGSIPPMLLWQQLGDTERKHQPQDSGGEEQSREGASQSCVVSGHARERELVNVQHKDLPKLQHTLQLQWKSRQSSCQSCQRSAAWLVVNSTEAFVVAGEVST